MKLSALDELKAEAEIELSKRFGKIEELRDERRDFGEILAHLDEGDEAQVSTSWASATYALRPAAVPAFRAAVEQSIAIVEEELRGLGVEIDEPAVLPADNDRTSDDVKDAESPFDLADGVQP